MQLYDQYQITMNLKKIRRLMKKAKIVCTLRQSRPMKAAMPKFKTTHYKKTFWSANLIKGKRRKFCLLILPTSTMQRNKKRLISVGCIRSVIHQFNHFFIVNLFHCFCDIQRKGNDLFLSLPFAPILDLRISFFVYHLHRLLFFVLDMGYTSLNIYLFSVL